MKPAKGMGHEVVEHWYSLVSDQNFSSLEVYDHIEDRIKEQQVPALEVSRIDLSEGGAFSAKREYLRMKRERLIFDVCAAPVGVNYFFSYRFYVEQVVVSVWHLIALFVSLNLLLVGSVKLLGVILGPFFLLLGSALLVWLMRNAIGMGLRDLDTTLLKIPVLGTIYEAFFRKDTYYRQDMRIAYGSIVSNIVKGEVERATAAKGVRLLREFSYSPVFDELYSAKERAPRQEDEVEPLPA